MYHTFERVPPSGLAAKNKGIEPSDPRRNYIAPLDTNTPKPNKLCKKLKDYEDEFHPLT